MNVISHLAYSNSRHPALNSGWDYAYDSTILTSHYSLGLGIPLLIMALGLERATGWIKRMNRYRRAIQIASGFFIITIGVLLLTNTMSLIAIWAFKNGLYVERFALFAAAPTYFTAILAELLSFLSPCVLPLIPAYLGYLSGHTLPRK